MSVSAVILAAGHGERMRTGVRKAFLELGGRPLFSHSVETFARASGVSEIVIVVHCNDLDAARSAVVSFAPRARIVAGGATRRESSVAGVRAAKGEYVLIHDGCRPFASLGLIERVLDATKRRNAVVPVLPSTDTLYRLDDARIEDVPDRTSIARAQTPQGFRRSLILRCLETADPAITDDASAVFEAGGPVFTVEGDPSNLKVTVPEDLRWANAFHGHSE